MDAAVLHEYGAPRFDQFADPEPTQGAVVVQVAAAALSQFGVMHASGQHVIKPPLLPAVAGNEGMGRLRDGRRVYFAGALPPFGSMAQYTLTDRHPHCARVRPAALRSRRRSRLGRSIPAR